MPDVVTSEALTVRLAILVYFGFQYRDLIWAGNVTSSRLLFSVPADLIWEFRFVVLADTELFFR